MTPVAGGKMFFVGSDPDHGVELWATDGTADGTALVKDIAPGTDSSLITYLTAVGTTVYFVDYLAGDRQLWKSDGTDAGTVPVRTGFFDLAELSAVGDRLLFRASDSTHGEELWTSDGTTAGTSMVADINPVGGSLDVQGSALFALGDRVVFFADDGTHGPEPWVSDGTAAGTILLADLNPGPGGSLGTADLFGRFRGAPLAGVGLFAAYGPSGWGLYATDGTPGGTAQLQNLNTQASALAIPPFIDRGGTPLFRADDGTTGTELWKSDGTEAGTALVKDLAPGPDSIPIGGLTAIGSQAFFTTTSFPSGSDLWTSDGTAAGTRSVVPAAYANSPPEAMAVTAFADKVLYAQPDGQVLHLWKVDPTGASAALVQSFDVTDWIQGSISFASVPVGDFLYFLLPGFGGPLYRSDGTAAGTIPVAPGPFFSGPMSRLGAGPRLLFASAGQVFVSDGTAAGTKALASLYVASRLIAAGGKVFFIGYDFASDMSELWVSDGTGAGTHIVKDIQHGFDFSSSLTSIGDHVFFVADDGVHGRELWVSDGTDAGTHLVKDILPGIDSSQPQDLTGVGHLLFFAATDGVHNLEMWKSDGTDAGTQMVQDIAPGDLPSSPWGFTASGPYIYFAANDGTHGFEPWALPRAGLGGFLQAR